MSTGVLHMRIRKGRKVYRFWSGVVDAYLTEECSKQQAMDFILQEAMKEAKREAEAAFVRADARGTASMLSDDCIVLGGPWRREKCHVHGTVHHDFKRRGTATDYCRGCSVCGEPELSPVHQAARGCR